MVPIAYALIWISTVIAISKCIGINHIPAMTFRFQFRLVFMVRLMILINKLSKLSFFFYFIHLNKCIVNTIFITEVEDEPNFNPFINLGKLFYAFYYKTLRQQSSF